MESLVKLGSDFKNVINDLENNEQEFKKWYDCEFPENDEVPKGYEKLSSFQILLLLRCFRPDRVVNGVKKFIKAFYNNDYYI